MNDESQLHEQLIRYVGGDSTEGEVRELSARLEVDPAACDLLAEILLQGGAIRDFAQSHSATQIIPMPKFLWIQWRPLIAAAAGIVFGMLCTSVMFAYVAPSLEKVITLLQESFESGPAPLVTGVPVEPGQWSGDYSEVVGEQQGVKPESGKKMLRFLRADYEGKANRDSSSVADVYRLIDLRPYREQFADGAAVVQFSAGFNAASFPEGDVYMCKMSLHAYDAQTVAGGPLRVDDMREGNGLAVAKVGGMMLDREPATRQRVTGDLRLPANTDFIMAHISIHHARGPSPRGTFGGHYVDDVRLTMTRRPPSQ